MVSHIYTALLVVFSLHLDATVAECECGKNNLEKRIVGGNESQVHEWPWLVAIRNHRGKQFCGGSLISQSWILTAAHCFDDSKPLKESIAWHRYSSYVCIAEHNLTGSETTHTVHRSFKQILVHEGYETGINFKLINDIAVVQLSYPVEYNHGIRPVCLPTNLLTQLFVGENATVAGWGITSHFGTGSNAVRDVTHPVISNTECEKMFYSKGFRIRDDQVCVYEEGKSACNGDSGGALVWLDDSGHYQQIGIVSFGDYCAWENNPGIYTRVTSYIDWIQEKTNINFCSP